MSVLPATRSPGHGPGPHRRAVAAVEFAFLLPLLVVLLLGLWEVGRVIHVYQMVSNAAREGGRQAATAKYTKAQVRQQVLDYLVSSGVPAAPGGNASVTLATMNATITVENLTSGGEVYDAGQLDQIKVAVSVPITNFRWVASSAFFSDTAEVQATAYFLCVKDVPINVTSTIPQAPLP